MKILYQDDSILVLDKPANLPVLPDGWDQDAPYLMQELETLLGTKPWVVHRLDKVTSGVMVFALTAEAHRALSVQFERHETGKVYRALVEGSPRWNEHTAKHPLRVNVGHKHRTAIDHTKGKPSVTHFRVLERWANSSLLEAVPETGRTHQVRVHAAALGHPLLMDTLYSGLEGIPGIDRPALHAYSLRFTHPVSGETVHYLAEYPQDFVDAMNALRSEPRL